MAIKIYFFLFIFELTKDLNSCFSFSKSLVMDELKGNPFSISLNIISHRLLCSVKFFMSHCGMGITPSPLGEHFSII